MRYHNYPSFSTPCIYVNRLFRIEISFYVPFVVNQVSNPDPLYWATNNYIISAQEEDSTASLQIYVVMQGVATSLFKKLDYYHDNGLKVEDLIQILKKMKAWGVKVPEKVHIDVVVKIHDKTVFATHMNQSRFESGSGEDLAYIEDFLRFGSHINQQIVLTWPNPGAQQGGVAMHSRAQIAVETSALKSTSTVTAGDNSLANLDNKSVFFDCERPMTGAEVLDKLFTSQNNHYDLEGAIFNSRRKITLRNPSQCCFFVSTVSEIDGTQPHTPRPQNSWEKKTTQMMEYQCDKHFISLCSSFLTSIQPSLIILNSILLFTSPPSGSCGLILPPQHLMKTENDVLRLKVQVNKMNVNEDTTKFDLSMLLNYFSREEPRKVFFEMEAVTKIETTGGNANLQLTIHGLQPSADNVTRKEWTICLREQDISHAASDQDISIHPASYEGHLTLTYSGNKSDCFESGPASELTLKYKGVPQNLYGKLERYFEVKIFGSNLSEMGILESDIVTQTALGQLLRSYSKEPLNVTAVIKERNGLASVSVNKGADMQFKSDNFAWLLDSWTDMQIMKTLGLYRECRVQENLVHLLFGGEEHVMSSDCHENVVLADCTERPKFAVIRERGGVKVYTGGFYVLVTSEEDQKPTVDSSHGGNHFWISRIRNTVKIVSRLTDLQVYFNKDELVVLVPHVYLDTVCGLCTNIHTYNVC
ncbi:hypothetical protein B5X24_HaOG214886 [Helicoverpa armigera]|uniref:VWFD domain-containing protein n=1 Tax=Helicoverpa armigera TaxID=29058 RepID=A0A2W1B678_HELAM|nr:hypothetical protein B5X24_HaOG214886 [Helicoverpa armigera]